MQREGGATPPQEDSHPTHLSCIMKVQNRKNDVRDGSHLGDLLKVQDCD